MNILLLGAGSGSWTMRGQQLGAALDARVTSTPTSADWRWADVAVLVKRFGLHYAKAAHYAGVPVVWDALDFWAQPAENSLSGEQAVVRLHDEIERVRPALTIGATQAMADACGGAYLPHHSWKGLEPIQARDTTALVVAYQGNRAYLGAWGDAIAASCQRRGWIAQLNPAEPWTADIVVAFRDAPWDGWMCRQWKSGVKLVNAIAAGRPVITQASAAAAELTPPGSIVTNVAELEAALDTWADLDARRRVVDACRALAPALRLPAVAERYRAILATVCARQGTAC
jgi:hypothetical protein